MANKLPTGAAKREGINAAVEAKARVLKGQQHGEIAGINLICLHRQPPAPIGRRIGPQQLIVAIKHGDGEGFSASKRERRHTLPNDLDRDRAAQQKKHRDEEG